MTFSVKTPRYIWANHLGDFTLNVLQLAHTSSYPSEHTRHKHCCHLVDTIGITTRVNAGTGTFLLHFKDGGRKKTCFVLCHFFYQIYCVIFSYIQFTFPQTSKCFLSNGTKNIHILASGPELQAVRFGYVI